MTLGMIGWVIAGTILTVIIVALFVMHTMFPSKLFEPPKPPDPPKPAPPPEGVDDLHEYRPNHWKQ